MTQLNLNLPINEGKDPYLQEDFMLLDENSAAVSFLEKFFFQKKFSQAQFQSLILRGEAKSGKTHLLNVFAKKRQAAFLQIEQISDANLSSFFKEDHFYILENIEEIKNEELLLHLINAAVESKAFLVLSAQGRVQFELRDLSSRVKNIFTLEIKSPSQDAIKILLMNAFARRQLRVSSSIINFINSNIERTYDAVIAVVNSVELHAQESGKGINLKNVKNLLLK